jgi:lambda repressor-like predicted transcriptional regulator
MEEDRDKDGDIYNKDVYREDIVARIKALGINLKKNISLY